MRGVRRDDRGIALAVALFALIIVGALVAGAFFSGAQEHRLGENQRRIHTAFSVAEAGAHHQLMIQDPAQLASRPLYPDDSVLIGPDLPAPDGGGTGRYGGYGYRVGPQLFLIVIAGRDTGFGGASQRMGLIARITPSDSVLTVSLLRSRGWLHLF